MRFGPSCLLPAPAVVCGGQDSDIADWHQHIVPTETGLENRVEVSQDFGGREVVFTAQYRPDSVRRLAHCCVLPNLLLPGCLPTAAYCSSALLRHATPCDAIHAPLHY